MTYSIKAGKLREDERLQPTRQQPSKRNANSWKKCCRPKHAGAVAERRKHRRARQQERDRQGQPTQRARKPQPYHEFLLHSFAPLGVLHTMRALARLTARSACARHCGRSSAGPLGHAAAVSLSVVPSSVVLPTLRRTLSVRPNSPGQT